MTEAADIENAATGPVFRGVVTTGVYCRTNCISRPPRPENMRRFVCVAEAEAAGFRPCRRCRPNEEEFEKRNTALVAEACRLIDAGNSSPTVAGSGSEGATGSSGSDENATPFAEDSSRRHSTDGCKHLSVFLSISLAEPLHYRFKNKLLRVVTQDLSVLHLICRPRGLKVDVQVAPPGYISLAQKAGSSRKGTYAIGKLLTRR